MRPTAAFGAARALSRQTSELYAQRDTGAAGD